MAPDLLSQTQRAVLDNGEVNLEEVASNYVSNTDSGPAVNYLAAELRKVGASYRPHHLSRCVELLAWLLVYQVIEPALLLEAMTMIDDFSALSVCGTAHFQRDVLNYLKIDTQSGKTAQFDKQPTEKQRIDTDLLDGFRSPLVGPVQTNEHLLNSEWEADARRILLGSISAAESVKKITDNFVRNSESSVISAVFRVTLEPKVYNRIMGNTMIQLLQDRRWPTPFKEAVAQFFTKDIDLIGEVYKLKVFGQFLGHVLSAHASLWPQVFPIFDLEQSASARIVILAVLQELRAEIGLESVKKRVHELPDIQGLTTSELAGAFWEMAGLPGIVD